MTVTCAYFDKARPSFRHSSFTNSYASDTRQIVGWVHWPNTLGPCLPTASSTTSPSRALHCRIQTRGHHHRHHHHRFVFFPSIQTHDRVICLRTGHVQKHCTRVSACSNEKIAHVLCLVRQSLATAHLLLAASLHSIVMLMYHGLVRPAQCTCFIAHSCPTSSPSYDIIKLINYNFPDSF